MKVRLLWLGILSVLLLTASCSPPPTPIDWESLSPEQQKIVREAQNFLNTSRLEFQSPPQVIRLEKTTRGHASQRIASDDSVFFDGKNSENATAWLVLFEGEMRIIPPDPTHSFTPGPFSHQCVYVMIDPATHMNALRSTRCPWRSPSIRTDD